MAILASVSLESSRTCKADNLEKIEGYVHQAASQNADLVVFPEFALTGLPTQPLQVLDPNDCAYQHEVAELIPEGPSVQHLINLARELNIHIVWGMAEQSPDRFDVLYNTVVLVGPDGYIGKHRKAHQALTERLMFYPGAGSYPVFDTSIGRIGMLVCYEKAFPETARLLATKGAQIIVCPTAWPSIKQCEDDPDYRAGHVFAYARALENMVVFVEAVQGGPEDMGHSRILGPHAMQTFATTGFGEGMAVTEVDVEREILHARLFAMGGSDLLKDRKPELYRNLCEPNPYCQSVVPYDPKED